MWIWVLEIGRPMVILTLVYRDPKAATDPDAAKTLTDEEVDQRHALVVEAVRNKYGAVLRT